jgi:hypothetical protein
MDFPSYPEDMSHSFIRADTAHDQLLERIGLIAEALPKDRASRSG